MENISKPMKIMNIKLIRDIIVYIFNESIKNVLLIKSTLFSEIREL